MNGNTYYKKHPCKIVLDSNARYCTLCGCESTFYQAKLLLPWEEEKKEKESVNKNNTVIPMPPLPSLKKYNRGEF